MPTVILLDVSLSMSRPVVMGDSSEECTRRHLAVHAINAILDHMEIHCKLEFVSLVNLLLLFLLVNLVFLPYFS